jgi:hypothetical protein
MSSVNLLLAEPDLPLSLADHEELKDRANFRKFELLKKIRNGTITVRSVNLCR